MIRVVLPAHLRALARINGEVRLDITGPVTQRSVLDALEARHPVLRGTIRDHDGGPRRAFMRFFACEQDLSHEPPDNPLPEAVVAGTEPYLIVGAMAGGLKADHDPIGGDVGAERCLELCLGILEGAAGSQQGRDLDARGGCGRGRRVPCPAAAATREE
jgi:hypothetical protein